MKLIRALLFASAVWAAKVVPRGHVVHEGRDATPEDWTDVKRIYSRAMLPVRIGLIQPNVDAGHDLLMDLADHTSPNFRQWLSSEDVIKHFAPSEDDVAAVWQWLESSGVASERISQSANKQWLQFNAPAHEVEALFHTEYYLHTHSVTGDSYISCEKYHVPGHISSLVDYVTPGVMPVGVRRGGKRSLKKRNNYLLPLHIERLPTSISEISRQSTQENTSSLCSSVITPDCIFAMYNLTAGSTAQAGNELGIFEGLAQYYSQTDLDDFFKAIYPTIPAGTHPKLEGVDGGGEGTVPAPVALAGGEAELDFQISYPVIWPQQSILFQTDDSYYESNYTFVGFLDTFLSALDGSYCTPQPQDPPYPDPNPGGWNASLQCGVYKPTNVISISYGSVEYYPGLTVAYQRRQCNEYLKLGLQGTTVVISSGDDGVGCGNASGLPEKIFTPGFPQNCPYVLAVGSTFLPPGADPATDAEIATTRFASGGGFSNLFTAPSYQQKAIAEYFDNNNPDIPYYETVNLTDIGKNGGVYNRIGRAYPDVSAVGDNILIYLQGFPALIGGTSASTPLWGAILTRVNEELLAKGKPTVGYVNPVLYSHPEVFHDITEGSNIPEYCLSQVGFNASTGWDPVTGLGTPDFPKLVSMFLSL